MSAKKPNLTKLSSIKGKTLLAGSIRGVITDVWNSGDSTIISVGESRLKVSINGTRLELTIAGKPVTRASVNGQSIFTLIGHAS